MLGDSGIEEFIGYILIAIAAWFLTIQGML